MGVELDKVAFGQPFSVTVHVQNRATEMRSVAAILSASSIYYTGVPARRLGRTDRQLVLQPGQRETLQVRVSWDEYRDKVVDYGMIKIYALASVAETKQTWSEEDDFQLEKPKLDVQVRGAAQVGQDCFVTFSFLNPLSVNLTECEFTFEGPGLVRPQTIKYRDVKMGEMVSHVQIHSATEWRAQTGRYVQFARADRRHRLATRSRPRLKPQTRNVYVYDRFNVLLIKTSE